ncbi:MAG: GC-type dockerin domain-anchored protein, partial [Planctomycetota bacterium]
EDFDAVSNDRLVVRKFGADTLTPTETADVEGSVFGVSDSVGKFHHHVQFFFENFAGPALEGVWLLTLRLETDSVIEPSDPVRIVFSQNADAEDVDAAMAFVAETMMGPASCNAADVGAPFGVLNASDINGFVAAFLSDGPAADLAAPAGIINSSDVNAFVSAFVAGCP